MKPIFTFLTFIFGFLLFPLESASALTDVIWSGGTGNWSNSALWSPVGVPNGALFNVLLDNGNALNSIVSLDTSATIGGLTIDAGDVLGINSNTTLTLSNATVNNVGLIALNSGGFSASLYIDGAVSLQGAGKITMNNGNNVIRYNSAPATDTLNNAQTIEGRGTIDVLLNNVAGHLVDANISGQTLSLNRATTNGTGSTLRASNGAILDLNSITVTNTGALIEAQAGSTVNLNNAVIIGGTISNVGGTINANGGSNTLDGSGAGITLNGTYSIGNNASTTLKGTVNNTGVIALNSGGFSAALSIDGTVNLQGAGRITMNNGNNVIHSTNTGDTLNNSQTIEGRGTIDVILNNTAGHLVDANLNGQILALNRATTNGSGTFLRASNGGTLQINSTVANAGATVEALAGSTVDLQNSIITGGTVRTVNNGQILLTSSSILGGAVSNSATGVIQTVLGSSVIEGLSNAAGGQVNIGSSSTLVVRNTVNNDGDIKLNSAGFSASLYIDGAVSLQGTGKITMNNGNNVIRYNSAPATDTLTNEQTIEGRGLIDVNLNNLAGNHLVNANISGQTLSLNRAVTNGTGSTLRASNGAILDLNSITVTNTGALIEAQAGSTVNLNNAVIIGGTLSNVGGTINANGGGNTLDGSGTGITLNGTYSIGGNNSTTVKGTVNNTGVIALNSGGYSATLNIDGTVNLQGAGRITMNNGNNVIHSTNTGDTLNNSQTIEGRGTIDVILNNTAGHLVDANLNGQILVLNRATTNGSGSFLRAESGGTLQINSTVANAGATVEALAGSTVDLQNSIITGGTVRTVGNGQILLTSSSILGGAVSNSATGVIQTVLGSSVIEGLSNAAGGQVNIGSSSTLVVRNTVTNDGDIKLNSAGFSASLYIDGAVSLQGTGKITMNNGNNVIRYNSTPATDTLTNGQTIEGRGVIDVKLNNQAGGLIDANVSGQTLTVAQSVTNSGIMQASGGGTLSLSTGTINNIGGTIQVFAASTLNLSNGTQIIGGTVANSGGALVFGSSVTLDGTDAAGITLQGAFTAPNGTSATLKGTVHNNGPISLNSTGSGASLYIDGLVYLKEAGQVTLGSGGGNQIRYNLSAGTDTLVSQQTIHGKGLIDVILNNTDGTLVDANVTGGSLTLNRATTNGAGSTLRASNGGTLQINGNVANTGTVEALADSTVDLQNSTVTGGTVRTVGSAQLLLSSSSILGAALSNSTTGVIQTVSGSSVIDGLNNAVGGQVNIASGTTLVVQHTLTNNGDINLNSGGSSASLVIDGTVTLAGTGKMMLNNGNNVIRYNNAAGTDTLNSSQTIAGRGTIDVLLNNQPGGLINANVSGQSLSLNRATINAAGGILRASNGGTLYLNNSTITNTGALIEAQALSTVTLSNATIIGGTVSNAGGTINAEGGTNTLDGSGAGIILNGAIGFGSNSSTTLKGTVNNNGTLALNSGASAASFYISGTVDLKGDTGKLTMNNFGSVIRSTSPGATLNNFQTIEGRGTIDVILNNTPGRLVNAKENGQTLTLNLATTNDSGSFLRASSGGTLQINSTVANTGATVEALAGSTVDLQNSIITGGIVQTVDSGKILLSNSQILVGTVSNASSGVIKTVSGSSEIDHLSNASGGLVDIGSNTTLVMRNTVNNEGDIKLNSGGSSARLSISGAVNLQGAGRITMNNGINGIQHNGAVASDTLTSSQIIEGRGTIDVKLINQLGGLIDANVSGQILSLNQDTANGPGSTLRASNGGILALNNPTVTNTGALIEAQAGSTVTLNNATIIGGTLSNAGGTINAEGGSNTLDGSGAGIILNGTYSIGNNAGTTVKGTVNNTGVIALNSGGYSATLNIDGTVYLQGAGRITMNNGNNVIHSTNTGDTLNNSQTIEGRGTIDVILNNTAGHLVDANLNGQSLTLSRATTNVGTLRAENGATLNLDGGGSSTGTIDIGTSSTVAFNGGSFTLAAGSAITGAGKARLTAGTLDVGSSVNATNLVVTGGTLTGPGVLDVSSSLAWSAGTFSGAGSTRIESGATLLIDTSSTKTLTTRDLINNGTASWTAGSINASDGAQFINDGTLVVSGNAAFNIATTGTPAKFINNGSLIVQSAAGFAAQAASELSASAAPASVFTIAGDIANGGTIEQRSGATITHTGNVTGSGSWNIFDAIGNWISGLFAPKSVTNTTTVSGSAGQLNIQRDSDVTVQAGGGLVASGGGNLVASGGGNLIATGGGNLIATGGGNLIATGGGNLIATGGGNLIATGGGNIIGEHSSGLVAGAGGTIQAINGGKLIATGGGNLIATGGGNASASGAGSQLVASGGGNLIATGGGNLVASGGGNLIATGGGNLIAAGGGNLVAAGGGNLIATGGGNFAEGSGEEPLIKSANGLTSASFTGPIILAENGGNIIGLTGGTFTGNMVAQSGGSLLPGNAGVVGAMVLNGGLDLQTGSLLKMDLLGLVQGVSYDVLNVAGSVAFNGNLLVNMAYALRTLASSDAFTLLTATSPITGTIGNVTGNRVTTADGLGSFKATYGTNNNLVLDDFQATTLTFALWQGAWSFASVPAKDFNADPDHDGATNGMEYALGMNPLASDADLLPVVSVIDVLGIKYLALTYVRQAGVNLPTDLTFAVERSTDITAPNGGWSTSGVTQLSTTPGPQAGFETVVVRSATPLGTPGVEHEFLRFKVTKL